MQGLLFSRVLLTGPHGSGKTHRILQRFLEELDRGNDQGTMLVLPTNSFREHTRNTVLRTGRATSFHDRSLVTFSDLAGDARLGVARKKLLVERLLGEMDLPYWRAVQEYQGFRDALAEEAEEFIAAGCRAGAVRAAKPRQAAFLEFVRRYETATAALRPLATIEKQPGVLLVDGFTDFTLEQRKILETLLEHCAHAIVTLPPEYDKPRRWLVEHLGFQVEPLEGNHRGTPTTSCFSAGTRYEEVDGVAEQIVRLVCDDGFQYRDIGVVLENREAYAPLVADLFRRRRIPARLYFPLTARDTAMGRHLLACLALLGSSPEDRPDAVLAVLKSPYSPVQSREVVSRFEYQVITRRRQAEQGNWDACLGSQSDPALREFVATLARLRTPLENPAATVRDLWAAWTNFPEAANAISHEHALELRADSQVWDLASQIVDEIGAAADSERVRLPAARFLALLQSELGDRRFHLRDRRVDVVNVMNPYEARQWELRAVFLLGMVESEFPRAPKAGLFLEDGQRQAAGLPTLAEQREEQQRLLAAATTRASQLLVLSYPQRDDRGNAVLPSLYLNEVQPMPAAGKLREVPEVPASPPAHLSSTTALARVREREVRFSASRFRNYSHCPFQHFGRNMLHLEGEPEIGLTRLLEGNIIHATLYEWESGGRREPIESVLDRCFAANTSGLMIGHAEQRRRNAMIEDLKRFLEAELHSSYRTVVDPALLEKSFGRERPGEDVQLLEWTLDDGSTILVRGRLDRVETATVDGRKIGVVVDFKYSLNGYKPKRKEDVRAGREFQIPLYLMALRDVLRLIPAGAELYKLRGEPERAGVINQSLAAAVFHGAPPESADIVPREEFRELMETGKQWMLRYAREIRDGAIAVEPKDHSLCKKAGCELYDVCRVDKWRPLHT